MSTLDKYVKRFQVFFMKYQTSSAYISKDICTSSFIILVYCLILDKNDNLKIVILEFTCSKIYKIAVKIKNWVIEINVIHVVPLSVYCHLLHWNNILKKKTHNKITSCGNRCGCHVTARKTLIWEHFFLQERSLFSLTENSLKLTTFFLKNFSIKTIFPGWI